MISACRAINDWWSDSGRYFYIAFPAEVLIFTGFCQQIPVVITLSRTVNYSWLLLCVYDFSAFPAVINIFPAASQVDPVVVALCRTISDIRTLGFDHFDITFPADIYMGVFCTVNRWEQNEEKKHNNFFHIIYLVKSIGRICWILKGWLLKMQKVRLRRKRDFCRIQ